MRVLSGYLGVGGFIIVVFFARNFQTSCFFQPFVYGIQDYNKVSVQLVYFVYIIAKFRHDRCNPGHGGNRCAGAFVQSQL